MMGSSYLRSLAVLLAWFALATGALLPLGHVAEAGAPAAAHGAEAPLAPDHDAASCEVCKQLAAARVAVPPAPLLPAQPERADRFELAPDSSATIVAPRNPEEARAPPSVLPS